MKRDAIVVGSGVSGLSCALALQEAGYRVQVWFEQSAEQSTSAVAAAIWYPYKVEQDERVMRWAFDSLQVFRGLSDEPKSGVLLRRGLELFAAPEPSTPWRRWLGRVRELPAGELPSGYTSGWEFELPVIEMPVYLPYLRRRFEGAGGVLVQKNLTDLGPACAQAPLVVHCSGLGARDLVGDRSMVPIRGQVLWVERRQVERFVLDDFNPSGPTYVVPRGNDCVLGGTADEGASEMIYDSAAAQSILERCVRLSPGLAGARITGQRVGLRPGRSSVRLEREDRPGGGTVIHNYGHGGAGVTLSWGCAGEVLRLARAALAS